ncbi:MAG: CoA pyrophosphatase [Pseudomonadota bacterium]|nr:CoA pyrophosphatase [Pseudomonadota bacterium]
MKKPLIRRWSEPTASRSASQLILPSLEQRLSFAPRPRCADASVLLALTDEPDPRVLLTRRSMQLNHHAGEVSLPGGKRDPADTSNIVVALREAHEETGLDPFAVRLLGELPSQRARSGLWVKPIVGVIPPDYPLVAQPSEIDRIFYVRLTELMLRPPQPYQIELNGRTMAVPSFQIDDEIIWGLTGRILVAMLQRGLGHRIDWPLFLMRYAAAKTPKFKE